MSARYVPLVTIECLHEYFSDRRCRGLSIRPTAQCQQLLERYRCLYRATESGIVVAGITGAEVDTLDLYDEELPFSFEVIVGDPLFVNYTDADPSRRVPGDAVYYFSNLKESTPEIGRSERLLLHPAGAALGAPPLPVRPKRFSHGLDAPLRQPRLEVVGGLNESPVWRLSAPGDIQSVALDLSGLPDGRYRLRANGEDLLEFYATDTLPSRCLGIVEIFPGGPAQAERVPENCRVLGRKDGSRHATFALSLSTRTSRWRYYIIAPPSEQLAYDGFEVAGTARTGASRADTQSTPLAFSEQASAHLDGRLARVFVSDQDIGLYERPGDVYDIVFKANVSAERGAKTIKLPFARAETTRLEESDGQTRMCSEIFVYL